jgi:hypothetical protein
MDLLTTLLFKTNGEVCGCPGLWGVGDTTGPEGQQLPGKQSPNHTMYLLVHPNFCELYWFLLIHWTGPYSSHHPTLSLQPISSSTASDLPSFLPTIHGQILFSPPTVPANIPSSPPTTTMDSPIPNTQVNLYAPSAPSAFSRYDRCCPSPTPSGPPQETCLLYYHGECKRGDKCDRAHETHFTWPVPPPPKYVHRKPCYLPLCPMKDGIEELLKSNSSSGYGRNSPGKIGIDSVDADTIVYVGANNAEETFVAAAEDEDSGELPTAQLASDEVTDVPPFIDNKNDIISLSSGSCNSTTASPSPPPASPMLASSPLPHPSNEPAEIASISYVGTRKRLRLSKPQTVPRSPANSVAAGPGETTLVTTRQPEHICETPHKPSKVSSIKEKICFFWYHQGYCRTKRGSTCPCVHTLDTGAREVSLPNELRSHSLDCQLPLCPARLRNKSEPRSVIQQKVVAQDKKGQPHPEWKRPPPTGPRYNEKTTDAPPGFALREKICFNWYHKGYCRPRKGTSCPCVHTLDTGMKEVALPENLRYHNVDCELSLCPVRLRCDSGHETVFVKKEEGDMAKDTYRSMMPAAIHPSRVQNMAAPQQPRMDTDRISLRRLRKQFTDRQNQLIQKYGSWQACPPDCVQPMRQLEKAIGLWDQRMGANSDPTVTLPIGFQQRAIALGDAIEEQKLQTRLKSRSGGHLQHREAFAHTPVALKAVVPNVVIDMNIATAPKGPRAMVVKPPKPLKSIAPTPVFGKAGNSNMVPVSRKRKSFASENQLSTRQVKRMRPTLFDARHEGDYPKMPVDPSSIVQTKPQAEVRKAQPGVLVDYVLPSGQDRAEWDTDFLRRAFGEIE